jgi:nucleoside-diphosphate-sugar epimerase
MDPTRKHEIREPILVTGATGFIGQHLLARLIGENRQVRAFLLPEETPPDAWNERAAIFRGDVRDTGSVSRAVEGVGTVIHLAAVVQDWGPTSWHHDVTVEGTRRVLTAAAQEGARAVLASSLTVYGDALQKGPCPEDVTWGSPTGLYSGSKQAQERAAWEVAQTTGLKLTAVRPGNVYGPGSKQWVDGVVAELRRRTPSLLGGGEFNAGLCSVENVVEGLLLSAASEKAVGQAYNINDDSDTTWKRYFSDLARYSGSPAPYSIPRWLAWVLAKTIEPIWKILPTRTRPPISYDAYNLVASDLQLPVDLARREMGYQPANTYKQAMEPVRQYLKNF